MLIQEYETIFVLAGFYKRASLLENFHLWEGLSTLSLCAVRLLHHTVYRSTGCQLLESCAGATVLVGALAESARSER